MRSIWMGDTTMPVPDYFNDEDPRQTAQFAFNALIDVIRRHPDVTDDMVTQELGPACKRLRELAGGSHD